MARQDALGVRGTQPHRLWWVAPLTVAAIALISLVGGADSLWQHVHSGESRPWRATCGVVLVALGSMQAWIAWRALHAHAACPVRPPLGLAARWLVVGVALCYVLALLLGPDPHVRYLFRAAVALWYTALLWTVTDARGAAAWGKAARPTPRRVINLACALVAAALSLEIALRVAERRDLWVVDAEGADMKIVGVPPGSGQAGETLADMETFAPRGARAFRVALVGDGAAFQNGTGRDLGEAIRRRMADAELCQIDCGCANNLSRRKMDQVLALRPDVVIVFLPASVATRERPPEPGAFDVRGLRIARLARLAAQQEAPCESWSRPQPRPTDYESYLTACVPRLAACRTPTRACVEQGWSDALHRLATLAARCHADRVTLALVVMPEEFQVNASLCAAVARRAGCDLEELDLELPQRRMVRFAHEHAVESLDLLACFRGRQVCFDGPTGCLNVHGKSLAAECVAGWLELRTEANRLVQSPTGR
ncbi:MAG: hypothetical protein HYX69_22800 [Planctomycetia bacterium]|nr:hypothetical protein [Planctomycetia bacterium]